MWAYSDDDAGLVPAFLAGGPEPFDVAVGAAWVDGSAEASHGGAEWDVAIFSFDGMSFVGEGVPVKCALIRWHDRYL
jgi:hypothetical protein